MLELLDELAGSERRGSTFGRSSMGGERNSLTQVAVGFVDVGGSAREDL